MVMFAVNALIIYLCGGITMMLVIVCLPDSDSEWPNDRFVIYCVAWPVFLVKHTIQLFVWLLHTTVKYAKE
jgi:hypothetical protein